MSMDVVKAMTAFIFQWKYSSSGYIFIQIKLIARFGNTPTKWKIICDILISPVNIKVT